MANSARIDELRKKFDENPRRYFAPLANEYRKAGDLEQAIFICQEYLPQQPGHMSGHIVYGQALYEMNRTEEALVVFETALSLDPENLIALRHLGDIACRMGDRSTARNWYQRVLEADPRNEEIAQIMLTLLSTPEPQPIPTPVSAAPAQQPVREREPVSSTAPTPLTSPAVVPPRQPADVPRADAGNDHGGFAVEKSGEEYPPSSQSAKTDDGHEFLDLNDFNLGGVPISSVGQASSAPDASHEDFIEAPIAGSAPDLVPMDNPADETSAEAPAEPDEAPVFALGQEEGPFEADPFAIAAQSHEPEPDAEAEPPPPMIELATDIELGLPDDGVSSDMSELPDEPFPSATLDGLETFEPGVIAAGPIDAQPIEAEAFFEPALAAAEPLLIEREPEAEPEHAPEPEPEPQPEPDHTSQPEAPATATASEPVEPLARSEPPEEESLIAPAIAFVTETMADLYLQQGHLESALGIFTQLVEQKPDDHALRERLRAVEERVYGKPAAAEPEPAPAYGGPTIREFLGALVARRAPMQVETEASYAPAVAPASTQPTAAADEDPMSAAAPRSDTGYAPSSETVSGSIDALFSGAGASSSDLSAASTLQEAFAPDTPDTAPLQGVPAHRASSELSLDHVFKGNSPPPPDNDGFSFDQFFAEEMSEPAAGGSGEGGAPSGAPTDDIAQFNAWLNGLKKS